MWNEVWWFSVFFLGGRDPGVHRREPSDPGGVQQVLWPRDQNGQLWPSLSDDDGHPEEAVDGVAVGPPQLGVLVIMHHPSSPPPWRCRQTSVFVCSKIAREDQREWWMKVCWNNWTCKSYSLSKMKWIAYKSWLNKRLIYYSKLGCCVAHVYLFLMAGIIKHQNVYLNEFERET